MAIGKVRQLKYIFSEKSFSLTSSEILILCTSFLIAILLVITCYQEVGVSAS